MYDEAGELHYVGYCSGFSAAQRVPLLEQFSQIRVEESFGRSARRPEQDHRWAYMCGSSWVPVTRRVVVEVSFDQVTNRRLRHAARFERWRPDRDAETCTLEQLATPAGPSLTELVEHLS